MKLPNNIPMTLISLRSFIASTCLIAGASTSQAAFVLIDDLDSASTGNLNGKGASNGSTWAATNNSIDLVTDPTDAGNQVALFNGSSAGASLSLGADNTLSNVDEDSGTLFFRVNFQAATGFNGALGLSRVLNPGNTTSNKTATPGVGDLKIGGSNALTQGLWYNVWIDFDLSPIGSGSDTYQVSLQGGTEYTSKTSVGGGNFRDPGTSWQDSDTLQSVFWRSNGTHSSALLIDDIYMDSSGINLANPTLIPEPSSVALLGLGGLALILRRRK